MANVIIPQRFWNRRGTAAALTAANETLYAGEWCLETDTGKAKFGDGVSNWVSLGYAVPGRIDLTDLADGDALVWDAAAERWVPGIAAGMASVVPGVGIDVDATDPANPIVSSTAPAIIGATFDGGGAAISAGSECDVRVPYGCTLTKATVIADAVGSLVVDVWADTFANYPPTVADSIAGAAKPTLAGADKSEDGSLTGWTPSIPAGAVVRFKVDSCAGISRATILLEGTRS